MLMRRPLHHYTYAEYAALESVSSEKHEFLDGEIYAMSGGTAEHSALAASMVRLLGNALGDRTCRVHTSDLRLYVESVGLATYPDASVICGPLQQHDGSPKSTALNPQILVEVTSDSSEEYDTTTKFEFYRTIPSLREYIILSHRQRHIIVHRRATDGSWATTDARRGESAEIPSIDAVLPVDAVYRNSSIP